MTLILTIENETSLPNGAPVSVKITDKRNLDIGRGAHLDWTLPDPSRFISGKHCEVRYRDEAYWLYDVSTNGTFLNDNTRRIQTPHKLRDGDRLAIGSYIISVKIEDDPPRHDPAIETSNLAEAAAIEAPEPELQSAAEDRLVLEPADEAHAETHEAGEAPSDLDTEGELAVEEHAGGEPQQELDEVSALESALLATTDAPRDHEELKAKETVAEDHAESEAAEAAREEHPAAEPAELAVQEEGSEAEPSEPELEETAAAQIAAAEPSQPAAEELPFAASIHRPIEAPGLASSQFASMPRVSETPLAFESPAPAPFTALPAEPALSADPSPPPRLPKAETPIDPTPVSAQVEGDKPDITLDEFIRHFAASAGIPAQIFERRDKLKTAEDLGYLMLFVVSSMKQLLSARDSAKRFARTSNRTVVQAFDNNPLKFAPTPEDALKIMFGPKTSGYLDARRALESAFGDLKTHQVKTFSAMQAAVKMLVEDFDPDEIDESLGQDKSFLSLLSSRKSRLWDLYLARWQAKTLRHEDGLVDAFMLYFAECYDSPDT